jgi:hypothetical protein
MANAMRALNIVRGGTAPAMMRYLHASQERRQAGRVCGCWVNVPGDLVFMQ